MTNERVHEAVDLFKGGLSCSQAILSTYGTLYNFNEADAVRIARSFGGGMGRLGETCGAVSGAFMAISLSIAGVDKQAKEDNYALLQEFGQRFKARYGSLNCRTLLEGCDLGTPDGQAHFRENGMMQSHCIPYVELAAEILEELLQLQQK